MLLVILVFVVEIVLPWVYAQTEAHLQEIPTYSLLTRLVILSPEVMMFAN